MDSSASNLFVQRLCETRTTLLASLQDVSEEQGRFKPAPGQWSIQDCVEHIALAEHGLFRQMSENWSLAVAPFSGEKEMGILDSGGGDRQRKVQAPERAQPTGRFGSLEEAARQFSAARDRTIDYVTAGTDDLRMRSTAHPLLGPMSCAELLAFLVVHPLRHAQQIAEIKQSTGYPGPQAGRA